MAISITFVIKYPLAEYDLYRLQAGNTISVPSLSPLNVTVTFVSVPAEGIISNLKLSITRPVTLSGLTDNSQTGVVLLSVPLCGAALWSVPRLYRLVSFISPYDI